MELTFEFRRKRSDEVQQKVHLSERSRPICHDSVVKSIESRMKNDERARLRQTKSNMCFAF